MCENFLQRMHGNLILYPEGTRSCNGEIQTFKKGAGLFAVDLGVPVVPAYIEGAHSILAKGKFMPRLGTVTVSFGEPIMFASNQFDSRVGRGSRRAAVELLEQRIRELSRRPPAADAISLPAAEEATISVSASVSAGANGNRNIKVASAADCRNR